MSRGFHAFFRQYYNLRALLTPHRSRAATGSPRCPTTRSSTRWAAPTPSPACRRTPPLNALAFALRSPTFPPRDLLRARTPRARCRWPPSASRASTRAWTTWTPRSFLAAINFPAAARHLAFEVFSRSFFADPAELSAAELATMFHFYFLGSAEGPALRRARPSRSRRRCGTRWPTTSPACGPTSAPAPASPTIRRAAPTGSRSAATAFDAVVLALRRARPAPGRGRVTGPRLTGVAGRGRRPADRAAVPRPAPLARPSRRSARGPRSSAPGTCHRWTTSAS